MCRGSLAQFCSVLAGCPEWLGVEVRSGLVFPLFDGFGVGVENEQADLFILN